MNPLNRQKLRITPSNDFNRSCTVLQLLSIADASTMTGSSRLSCAGIVSGTTVLYRPKEGKGRVQQGGGDTAGFPSKYVVCFERIPRHGY